MKTASLSILLALAAQTAGANEFEPRIRDYLQHQIMGWAGDPVLVSAIIAQNEAHHGFDAAHIENLDQAWRAEVGGAVTPTITPVIANPASDFLRERVEASGGAILEVFVMDNLGLNVAASDVTSDYWQGDEAKFSQTFQVGPDAVFIDEVEFDESTQSYLAQVSVTISDPATHRPIGAMTIGLNADSLY